MCKRKRNDNRNVHCIHVNRPKKINGIEPPHSNCCASFCLRHKNSVFGINQVNVCFVCLNRINVRLFFFNPHAQNYEIP